MTDFVGFKHGATSYPLPAQGSGIGGIGASLLRDADASLFYLLEFFASCLKTHLEPRLLAEVATVGMDDRISAAVGETLPLNPEPYLVESQIQFPLLAAYRQGTKFIYMGTQKLSVDEYEVAYVFPAMQAGEAERLVPSLRAVVGIIDDRTEQGFDPAYTPTSPTGTPGEHVWARAGVARAEVKSVKYGAYQPTESLYFPAVIIGLELQERTDFTDSGFQDMAGVDAHVDLNPVPDQELLDVAQFATNPAPTLTSLSVTSGTKAGGTTVTITGTGFIASTTPTVLFGGLAATAVVVLSTTQVRCVTPAHDAFDTFAADVKVTNPDGQSASLAAAYTFTTP